MVFNVANGLIVWLFFPETKGLELEDVDHIFEKGGVTGGVWTSPGGRTVERRRIAKDVETMERDGKFTKGEVDVRIEDEKEKD